MDDSSAPLRQQPLQKTNKLWTVCIFILAVEMCERLCYYTLRGSQKTFFLQAHAPGADGKSLSECIALLNCFTMLAYLFPVAGGYLADNRLGKYRTILCFGAVYVAGTWMMDIAAIKHLMQSDTGFWLYAVACLGFVAIGTGAIKPNVVNFGADQYDENNPAEAEQRISFFQYFYMIINVGGIASSIWTVTIATSGIKNDDPGNGFFQSYLIAAAVMTIGYLVFIAGTPRYQHCEKATHKPMLSVLVQYVKQGAAKAARGKVAVLGWCLVPVYIILTLITNLLGKYQKAVLKGFNDTDGIAVISLVAFSLACISLCAIIYGHYNNDWIVELSSAIPGTELTKENTKAAFRIIPSIFLVNVGFMMCYNSQDEYSVMACQMDVQLPDWQWLRDFLMCKQGQLNGNFYGLADQAAIIICIPLLENVIFPAFKRRNNGRPVSRKVKYAWGFGFIILANTTAILIEHVRRGMSTGDHADFVPCPVTEFAKCDKTLVDTSLCLCGPIGDVAIADMETMSNWYLLSQCAAFSNRSVVLSNGTTIFRDFKLPMTQMSAWWTAIPLFLTGVGEILVNPVVQEFAYDECPSMLRSLMMGINCLAGGTIASTFTAFFAFLIPNDLNVGNLIPYFLVIIALSIFFFGSYLTIATTDRRIEDFSES